MKKQTKNVLTLSSLFAKLKDIPEKISKVVHEIERNDREYKYIL